MDARTQELEQSRVKTIVIDQSFGFFDRPVPTGDDELMETADIRNKNSEELIGGLIGSAKTEGGGRITGNDLLQVTFEIRSKAENRSQEVDPMELNEGFPFENPIFYMDTPVGLFASLGVKTGKNVKSIAFNDWIEIKKDENVSKAKIIQMVKDRKAQPRSIRLYDLNNSSFRINLTVTHQQPTTN